MTNITFFIFFIPLLSLAFLALNFLFASHKPYQEKNSPFECGFHSFLGQNRTQFNISFFIFALLFLLFDLEILLVYPYTVSAYTISIYGLVIMLIFFLVLTLGFAFELGKNALKIDSKQLIVTSNTTNSITNLRSNGTLLFINPVLLGDIYSRFSEYFALYGFYLFILSATLLISTWALFALTEEEIQARIDAEIAAEVSHIDFWHRINKRRECIHNWQPYHKSISCGYQASWQYPTCTVQRETCLKCTKCNEIRCSVHAQAHWGQNEGPGGSRNSPSPSPVPNSPTNPPVPNSPTNPPVPNSPVPDSPVPASSTHPANSPPSSPPPSKKLKFSPPSP